MTATRWPPGSPAGKKVRPSAGLTPSTRKNSAVTCRAGMRSGPSTPVKLNCWAIPFHAAISSKTWFWPRQCWMPTQAVPQRPGSTTVGQVKQCANQISTKGCRKIANKTLFVARMRMYGLTQETNAAAVTRCNSVQCRSGDLSQSIMVQLFVLEQFPALRGIGSLIAGPHSTFRSFPGCSPTITSSASMRLLVFMFRTLRL